MYFCKQAGAYPVAMIKVSSCDSVRYLQFHYLSQPCRILPLRPSHLLYVRFPSSLLCHRRREDYWASQVALKLLPLPYWGSKDVVSAAFAREHQIRIEASPNSFRLGNSKTTRLTGKLNAPSDHVAMRLGVDPS